MRGALRDRHETGEDPPVVRLQPSYFERRQVRLPADREDLGPMTTYHDPPEKEGHFCPLEEGEGEANETPVPKCALVPAKICSGRAGRRVRAMGSLRHAWTDLEEETSEEAKHLLTPGKDGAWAAAWRGDHGAETSEMAYIRTPVSGAPTQAMRDSKSR